MCHTGYPALSMPSVKCVCMSPVEVSDGENQVREPSEWTAVQINSCPVKIG